jgi:hypothetical protein
VLRIGTDGFDLRTAISFGAVYYKQCYLQWSCTAYIIIRKPLITKKWKKYNIMDKESVRIPTSACFSTFFWDEPDFCPNVSWTPKLNNNYKVSYKFYGRMELCVCGTAASNGPTVNLPDDLWMSMENRRYFSWQKKIEMLAEITKLFPICLLKVANELPGMEPFLTE